MTAGYGDFLGTGWAFPVHADGGVVVTAADQEDISQAIGLILDTAVGERVMRPEFGSRLQELVFEPNNATTVSLAKNYVQQALGRWEPRINLDDVVVTPTGNRLDIEVIYRIRTSNVAANLVYPFFLQG